MQIHSNYKRERTAGLNNKNLEYLSIKVFEKFYVYTQLSFVHFAALLIRNFCKLSRIFNSKKANNAN